VADAPVPEIESKPRLVTETGRTKSHSYSILEFAGLVRRRRWFLACAVGGLLLLCLLYCLIAPNQYEASAKIALRMQPSSLLTVNTAEAVAPASILSTPLQLETLVNVLRSERLEWKVLTELKLYDSPAFVRNFGARFPRFTPEKPGAEAQSYLLDRFAKRLKVSTLPRTLLIEVRFRSKDPALSAKVANELIRAYQTEESDSRTEATRDASAWLAGQLTSLTAEVEGKEKRLAELERQHGFMTTQQTTAGGQPTEILNDPNTQQLDEIGRLLAAAEGDRILREALLRQAQLGNPEQVLAANPELQAEMGPSGAALAQQLRGRLSEAAVEMAQLQVEHGPNYPRLVELERSRQDIETQIKVEDANLMDGFRRAWLAAQDREKLLREQMDARVGEGLRQNDAAMQYTVLHEEVLSGRELCNRLEGRIREAGLSAGVRGSSITVVDWAREPFKPVTPDLPLYMAIALFCGIWLGLGGALLLDALQAAPGVAE